MTLCWVFVIGIEDGSTYYTLTYYPENKNWDGLFRRIQVKSDRAEREFALSRRLLCG